MARSKARQANGVVESLEKLLGASYTLYTKTQNFHWNVTGPMFTTLHTLFETQYVELVAAVDEIAERIRALGARAPGGFSEFQKLSAVREAGPGVPAAKQMVRILADDQRRLVETAQALVTAAQAAGDEASADLGIRRIQIHEKNAWMLRSHLE
jgi:starvation-inducible DNA-binding protein